MTLADGELNPAGEAARTWHALQNKKEVYPETLFRERTERAELDPVFVWWHTLSHLLIRSVALDSGYSGASIRERIYTQTIGGLVQGGLIIYTVQQGADGSLGGLISMVPRLERIFRRIAAEAGRCSNDPLCGANRVKPGSVSGSSCYACLLLSETSCEHRNMWLDRMVLLDS